MDRLGPDAFGSAPTSGQCRNSGSIEIIPDSLPDDLQDRLPDDLQDRQNLSSQYLGRSEEENDEGRDNAGGVIGQDHGVHTTGQDVLQQRLGSIYYDNPRELERYLLLTRTAIGERNAESAKSQIEADCIRKVYQGVWDMINVRIRLLNQDQIGITDGTQEGVSINAITNSILELSQKSRIKGMEDVLEYLQACAKDAETKAESEKASLKEMQTHIAEAESSIRRFKTKGT